MIPIISPESVEEIGEVDSRIKKIKIQKSKIEKIEEEKSSVPFTKSEENAMDKAVEDIIGEEGDIEGKEEEILKRVLEEIEKEEKRRGLKQKQKEKKERETIHVGPLYPALPTPEKEHSHEKSIIPIGNYCCSKLCKNLNDEIFNKEETLGATAQIYMKGERQPFYRSFPSIPYAIEALKDYRYLLRENNVCKCYRETEKIEAPLPVIGGSPQKLISSRTGKPVTSGGLRYELPKSIIHIAHRKDKPTVPTHNGCCTEACDILTKKISKMENMLDKIELRGGKELKLRLGLSQRYEALAFKTFALQEYRTKLTKNNICECIK
jgi:hypothetical protein